jgi:hypothetical protein
MNDLDAGKPAPRREEAARIRQRIWQMKARCGARHGVGRKRYGNLVD